jgi:DNA repair/transcription protein MET18/MMS19
MTECLPIYGASAAHRFARTMWDSLKIEVKTYYIFFWSLLTSFYHQVFQPTDLMTEGEALKAIQALVKTICASETDGKEDIQAFPKEICEECIKILQEPEKSRAKHAIKILCTLVHTTRESA